MLSKCPVKFDAPTSYRIIVQGVLPENYYPYFEGMKIMRQKCEGEIDNTVIIGKVKDQADLAGILMKLYDFHYSILLIQNTEINDCEAKQAEGGYIR